MRRFETALLVLASLLFPRLAAACPVCGQGREGTESALLVMSGVLSALPLLMAGGIAVWIVLRARAASREAADERRDDARAVMQPRANAEQ